MPPLAPAEPTTIDVWLSSHPIPGFLDSVTAAARSFERAHPEYAIRTRDFFFRDMPREVAGAVDRGDPPDLADYNFTATQLARDTRGPDRQPLFTTITRAVRGRSEIFGERVVIDDLVPAVRDYYSDRDGLVSMPANASTVILFANQDLLRRAGVGRLPATWTELEAACAAVTALPGGPAHAVTWANHGWMLEMELAAQGGLLADNDNGRSGRAKTVTLHSPEILRYAHWWARMYRDGHYLYTGEQGDWRGGMEAFQRQEVAFVAGSSAVCLLFEEMAAGAGFELAAGPLPREAGRPYAGRSVGGQSLFLRAGLPAEREDGALAFLQHLLNPRNAVARQHTGSVPVTVPAAQLADREGWFARHPSLWVAAEQISSSDGTPAATGAMMGGIPAVDDALTEAMHDVLTAGADPETRFRAATEQAQAVLDHYNSACLADPPRTPDGLDGG